MAKKIVSSRKAVKAPAKKAKTAVKAAAPASKKLPVATKPYNKTQILSTLSTLVGDITKKQASEVIDALGKILEAHLKKGAAGVFTLPGMMKCYILHKPATKAHKGINPFTKEEMMFKAKPARNVVRIRPLKKLKDIV
jgi:nucleoid DNA-binding protein